ncbi:putative ABC transporter permease [Paradesulfitobacterium aromaticivorans]
MLSLLWLDHFSYTVLTFASYAFAGWILESAYRSLTQQHIVNPGFLKGPFLPLYGSFTLLVAMTDPWISDLAWEWRFIYFVVLSTALEYVSGLCLERFFHLQLWDYSDTPLNFQGRIALPFSLIWGVLGLVFARFIHPQFHDYLLGIPSSPKIILAFIFIIYLVWDIIQSTILLHRLKRIVDIFQQNHTLQSHERLVVLFRPFRRLLSTYPKLRHTLNETVSLLQAKQDSVEQFVKRQRQKILGQNKED